MKRLVKLSICLIFSTIAVGGAYAQFAKSEDAIKYRKAVMFLIAQHFGRMGAMVKEKIPYNQEVFTRNAMLVETLSRLPWEASMVPGTDKGDTSLARWPKAVRAVTNSFAPSRVVAWGDENTLVTLCT